MKPLRILHVVEASFAGVGRHVLDLVDGCAAAGDTVDVVYGSGRVGADFLARLSESPVRQVHAVPVGRVPGPADLTALVSIARFVRRHGPYDVVHGHASKGGAYARLVPVGPAARIYTPNALVTQSPTLGRVQRRLYTAIERLLAPRTDCLVYVSPDEAAHGHSVGLAPRAEVVVPNGIPLVELPTRSAARAALGLPDDRFVIGFVGRLDAQKGLDRLIDAVATMAHGDVMLAVIGDGVDGAALRSQAADRGVADQVRWLGVQPGQASMPAFDLMALPSRYEGFPYVALEALWAGVRVVATDRCGTSSLLGDGTAGVIVDGGDAVVVSALAAALDAEVARIVDDPLGACSRRHAARLVVENHSVEAMVDATRRLYIDSVSGRGPG